MSFIENLEQQGIHSSANTPVTRKAFAIAVLKQLGFNPRAHNTGMLMRWMQMEFSKSNMDREDPTKIRSLGARFNPMATTHGHNGGFSGHTPTAFNDNNGQSVQHYETFEMGIKATADTLQNGNYPRVLELLRDNAPVSQWSNEIKGAMNSDGKPIQGSLGWQLNKWGGLINSENNYDISDVGIYEDIEVFSGDLTAYNTFNGGYKSQASGQAYKRIPTGHRAVKISGKNKTYLVYNMMPGKNVKIAFEVAQGDSVDSVSTVTEADWASQSENYIMGGRTDEGIFADSSFNNGTRSFEDMMEQLLMESGLWGSDALESDEVLAVIGEFIMRPDMEPAELDARLQDTDWWDQTTQAQREWNDLSTADQIKTIKDNAQAIAGLWTAYTGEQLDLMSYDTDGDGSVSVDEIGAGNTELGEWARKLSTGEVSQQTIILEWIRPAALEIEGSPANRIIIEEEQAQNEQGFTVSENKKLVADLWERYGLDISDEDATRYATQMYMQEVTLSDLEGSTTIGEDGEISALENTARELSNVRWAGKPEDVDFNTWASPYKTAYSDLLEVSSPTFRDENFVRFLDDGLGSEGGMNMYDFKKAVRGDSRWKNTENAKAAVSQTLGSIGRMMGFG